MDGSFLALSWSCFSGYQNPCHVLLLAQLVHFEVESTHPLGLTTGQWNAAIQELKRLAGAAGGGEAWGAVCAEHSATRRAK